MKNVWVLIALTHLFVVTNANAAEKVSFERFEIDPLFRSEGVAAADLNRDGKRDIVVGDLWYAAPDWKPLCFTNRQKNVD